jgi:hypothetical protein
MTKMLNFKKNKKAYYFSVDALIALLLILGVVLFIKPQHSQVQYETHLQEDLIISLSSIKIGEIDNSYAKQLIASGNITNLNQSVLDQLGEFYANNDAAANMLADSILDGLNLSKNLGLYFGNTEIAKSEVSPYNDADTIYTSRQIISGIQQGNATKGYSARAFLSSANKVDYFYFGGYVGDGNITVKITGEIIDGNIEGVFSRPFNLSINNVNVGVFNPNPNVPYKIDLSPYSSNFVSGDNYFEFKSFNGTLYVAGGFIKIIYSNVPYLNGRKNFPGIDGLINLYDSFYIPSTITRIESLLRYNSSYDIFFMIGNKTVYQGNSSGQIVNISLDNAYLSSLLDYSTLEDKTIPFRVGFVNASYTFNVTLPADVISTNDISGSMASTCSGVTCGRSSCCNSSCGWCVNNATRCGECGGIYEDKIGESKNATKLFVDIVLNSSINRVGLAAYSTSALLSNTHALSTNNVSLKAEVDSWSATGGTCICCGINRAVNMLATQSNSSKSRSIVVMSDGAPTYYCNSYTDYSGSGSRGDWSGGISDALDQQWAVNAACAAYNNYSIKVYAIGFGSNINRQVMEDIANCGHGNYYFVNVSQLESIYRQVASDVIQAAYVEQTIVGEGINTRLYPDSYINISYKESIPYGLVVVSETPEFNNNLSQGSFFVPNDTAPYDAKVVSYSGSKWTSKVEKYNNVTGTWDNIFDLGEYGVNFTKLGDPYMVNIPPSLINVGNNSVRVGVGLNPFNASAGSPYNKVIYSVLKEISSYTAILPFANGCEWEVEFEDGTTSTFKVPSNYSGSGSCSYTSSLQSYDENDAINNAVFKLLQEMDLNLNGKIETKFSENDLSINSVEVSGIPFAWETEVQVRTWK